LYDGGKLHYVGHVGTGFDTKTLAKMTEKLAQLERKTSPFADEIDTNTPAHWVKPQLVAEVRFTEWTREGNMRHPAFLGLRLDKDPKDCTRERPADSDEVK
jgi:bifunctional non-homologous end joining protein LigD